MKMKNNMNWYLRLGLLITGIIMGVNHFIQLPHILYGFGLGLGIALEFIGIYAIKHDLSKIKNFKKNLIRGIVRN